MRFLLSGALASSLFSSIRRNPPVFLSSFRGANSLFAMSRKPVIAIDMDEVLARFTHCLARFHNHHYETDLTEDSFSSYLFHEVWGGTVDECNVKMGQFFESEHFRDALHPIDGVYESLQRLKKHFSLHIVTARQNQIEDLTRSWINRHYPDTFDDIHFGNHFGGPGDRIRTKAEMCAELQALCLVDDSPKYVLNCMQHGIRAFVFGDYPWNSAHNQQIHEEGFVVRYLMDNDAVRSEADVVQALTKSDLDVAHTIFRLRNWSEAEVAIRAFFADALKANGKADNSSAPTDAPASDSSAPSSDKKDGDELRVVVLQLRSVNSVDDNLRTIESLVDRIALQASASLATASLDLVCLPECALYMGVDSADTLAQRIDLQHYLAHHNEVSEAEEEVLKEVSGETERQRRSVQVLRRLARLARKHNVSVSVGGFPEDPSTSDSTSDAKMFNTHLLIDRSGRILQPAYRKIHLFDCPFADLFESKRTLAGKDVVSQPLAASTSTPSTSVWRAGLTTCYDLRFPALYEELRTAHACDLVLVPSAFTQVTGAAHWEVLLRARAIEQQVFVIAAAQTGEHPVSGRRSFGHSLVVDPWGHVLTPTLFTALREDPETDWSTAEGAALYQLHKSRIEEVRSRMPVQDHKRRDVY